MTRTTCLGLVAVALVGLAVIAWSAVSPVGLLRRTETQQRHESGETQEHLSPLAETVTPPEVRLSAPIPPGPVVFEPTAPPAAKLMQPVPPDLSVPEAPAQVTAARLPLIPPLREADGSPRSTWTQPEPLDHATATASAAVPPPPRVRVPEPMPSLTDALLAPARTRSRVTLFTGTHACSVGDCRELVLPATVRRQLSGARLLYALPGPDRTVLLYTTEGLDRLAGQLDRSPAAAVKVRRARRVSFAQAESCPLDRDGRTRLPDAVARHAGVCGEAVLVGVGDHLELWEPSRWDNYLHDSRNRAD